MTEARRELLPGLHGLRAAAAMVVFAYHVHSYGFVDVPALVFWIGTHGGLGVHLFFALSAFSLAWANPDAAYRPGPYLIKRFFRIAPLYWLLIIPVLVFRPWPGTGRVLAEFAFVFNFVPAWVVGLVPAGWTIGVEMAFYVCLPLLLRIRSFGGMALAALAATAFSAWARVELSALFGDGSHFALMSLASNFWVFVVALAAFRLFVQVRGTPAEGRTAAIAAIAAVGLTVVILSPLGRPLVGPGHPDLLLLGYAFAALCLWQALRPSRPMACRVAQWLGERSYSIYLGHIPAIGAVRPAYPHLVAWFGQGSIAYTLALLLALPLVLLFAELGYRFVERPGIALGRRVSARWRERGAAQPA